MNILSVCKLPRLVAKIDIPLNHPYYDDILRIAYDRLTAVFEGFSNVQIFWQGTKAYVHFDDMDDCLFALSRHRFIDVVPGEFEWHCKLKIGKEHAHLEDMKDYIVVVSNIEDAMSSDSLFLKLSLFGDIYSIKRDWKKNLAYVKYSDMASAKYMISEKSSNGLVFRQFV